MARSQASSTKGLAQHHETPGDWQSAIRAVRLILVSPFSDRQRRVTTELATERNRFVAAISDYLLLRYALRGGKTEALTLEVSSEGK